MEYDKIVAIKWADSADKHGIPHADVLHAVVNAEWHIKEFDEPRVSGGIRPDAWIGPGRDGQSIEVFAEVGPEPDVFIFHVMPPRTKTHHRLEQITRRRKR